MKWRQVAVMLMISLLFSGCVTKPTPEPTAVPTATPQTVPMGFTEDGVPYRGNPNASVTLWEFSEYQ